MADNRVLTLNFPDETRVDLVFEDGCDVAHYNDDYHDYVYDDTNIFGVAASLVVSEHFKNNEKLQELRNQEYLDEYERGSFDFETFVGNALRENSWDFIEGTLEQYDYKRGFYRVNFTFPTTLGQLKAAVSADATEVKPYTVVVHTDVGDLTIE
jgi:hypothetical protein